MKLPFWQKDKRRIDSELLDYHLHMRVTKKEEEFLNEQSKKQCRSKNSILRELIKRYKQRLGIELEH